MRPNWTCLHPIALASAAALVCAGLSRAQIPDGFELVEVTSGPDQHGVPAINICGQIVFTYGVQATVVQEVFLYDNGALTQMTNNLVSDTFPDINDDGVIAWTSNYDSRNGDIVLYDGTGTTVIGFGSGPSINNLDHVAWQIITPETCAFESTVFFYDGNSVEQISYNRLSNQVPRLNDADAVVWTRYDFCASPWESDTMLYVGGMVQELPSQSPTPQIPTINNQGQVAWGSPGGIELWEDGSATLVTDWGRNPYLNDLGEIYFLRWHNDISTWQSWLYRPDSGGVFFRLTDDLVWNTDGDINDWGEIVWHWREDPYIEAGGIRFVRRIRTGEYDFDGDIDLDDYAAFEACLTGPGPVDGLCQCRFLDIDHDRDIDLEDFARLQSAFTGQ
ncbi:MAG: hypothetical protein ACYSVY_18650 [Planctomycetota bacterium]|jgi:hypothetical protein